MTKERSKFYIIDRRLNGRAKSSPNRAKFLLRQEAAIRDAVREAISSRNITDMDKDGVDVTISRKTIHEPTFHNNYRTGVRHGVNVGNKSYNTGDFVRKPMSGEGEGGRGEGGDSGDGQDDFTFSISRKEFMDYFFEDLALPNLINTSIANSEEFEWVRSGFTNDGTPANLDLTGTMRKSIGRRLVLRKPKEKELLKLQLELEQLEACAHHDLDQIERMEELRDLIKSQQKSCGAVPFIDKLDLQYRTHTKEIRPVTNAVMFCVMDVSGSMGQYEKDLAKRFYTLLYMFLGRNYENLEVRFIRHHHIPREVDEDAFFNDRDSGGTVVSTAMNLVRDIIDDEYSDGNWNIYVAQASDGDNFGNDEQLLEEAVTTSILPCVQHMAYIEVGGHYESMGRESSIMRSYKKIATSRRNLDLALVNEPSDIWPVFRELFRKNRTDVKT